MDFVPDKCGAAKLANRACQRPEAARLTHAPNPQNVTDELHNRAGRVGIRLNSSFTHIIMKCNVATCQVFSLRSFLDTLPVPELVVRRDHISSAYARLAWAICSPVTYSRFSVYSRCRDRYFFIWALNHAASSAGDDGSSRSTKSFARRDVATVSYAFANVL